MSASTTSQSFDNEIASVGRPDLSTRQGRADHRSHVLLTIVRRLQTLDRTAPADAMALFPTILKHLYALHAIGLLTEAELTLSFNDLHRAYVREQPSLIDLLPAKAEVDSRYA